MKEVNDKADDFDEPIDVSTVVERFCSGVDTELATRLAAWTPDFAHIQVYEVIGGMLARQATLVKELAHSVPIWTGHSAPIHLRAIADVYISIAWLLLNPADRCLKFISYGLGQDKLQLEHRRAEIENRTATSEESAMLDAWEAWINHQRSTFLLDVELGSWSGMSVRKMAEEADCLDFYNFVYTPFSACAHSMWNHIARYNLIVCSNPLHRYHRRPVSEEIELDIHYLLLAAKYWTKTLNTFDQRTGVTVNKPSAYEQLMRDVTNPAVPLSDSDDVEPIDT